MEVPFALVKVSWERPLSPEPNLQNFPSIPALDLFVPHESLSNFEDFLSHQLQPLSVAQQFLQNLPGLTLLEILEMQNEANSKAWSIKLWDLQAHRLFIKPFGCVAYLLLCHLCHWHLGTLEHVSCVSILALPASLSSIRIEKSFQSKKQDAGRWYLRCPRLSGCTQNHPSIHQFILPRKWLIAALVSVEKLYMAHHGTMKLQLCHPEAMITWRSGKTLHSLFFVQPFF